MKEFWDWIKSFFTKEETPIIIRVPNPPVIPGITSRKVAVVVGHNATDKGAKSFNGISEYDYNKEVAKYINAKTLFRNSELSYFGQCQDIAAQVKNGKFDYVICLHFNSYNTRVQGTETLFMDNPSFAIMANDKVAKFTGFHNRGAKYANRGKTMINAIEQAGAKCILLEPFFGDEKQCKELLKKHKEYGEVINEIFDTAIADKL